MVGPKAQDQHVLVEFGRLKAQRFLHFFRRAGLRVQPTLPNCWQVPPVARRAWLGSDATGGVLGSSRWRLVWLRRRFQLLTVPLLLIMVVAAQVAEISVVTEKRRLLLEVQRCSWCRWLMLSVRRKRGVTCGRDGGNPSPVAGLSLLTIAGVGARDW